MKMNIEKLYISKNYFNKNIRRRKKKIFRRRRRKKKN